MPTVSVITEAAVETNPTRTKTIVVTTIRINVDGIIATEHRMNKQSQLHGHRAPSLVLRLLKARPRQKSKSKRLSERTRQNRTHLKLGKRLHSRMTQTLSGIFKRLLSSWRSSQLILLANLLPHNGMTTLPSRQRIMPSVSKPNSSIRRIQTHSSPPCETPNTGQF